MNTRVTNKTSSWPRAHVEVLLEVAATRMTRRSVFVGYRCKQVFKELPLDWCIPELEDRKQAPEIIGWSPLPMSLGEFDCDVVDVDEGDEQWHMNEEDVPISVS